MLFKSTTLLKEFAQLSGDVNFASLKATLRFVETFHIATLLGAELYTELNDAYTAALNETSLSSAHKKLLEQCRLVIGPYFCYYYAPKADVQLTDAGLTKNKEAAYQYQGAAFKEANLREAELSEELLLQFLEVNKADYTSWSNSAAFKAFRSLFIKTGTEFDSLVKTASPQRNYFAMRSKMVDVEEQMVRMAIGDTLFAALKLKDAGTQTFSTEETALLFKLKKAIAYQTIFLSIPALNVRVDAAGLSVITTGAQTSNDLTSSRSNADEVSLSGFMSSAAAGAKIWLSDAVAYLQKNATALGYTIPVVVTESKSFNEDLKGSFGLC